MTIVPAARPRRSDADVLAAIAPFNIDRQEWQVLLVGVRGYYPDSFGAKGRNDRGYYDDAMFLVTPWGVFPFNANTDPGKVRLGRGNGAGKGMASLKPGLVYYAHQIGIHRAGTKGAHRALVQTAGKVTVVRDGKPPEEYSGFFGINIHRGGNTRTNSEGCQTIPPTQWPEFIAAVDKARRQAGQVIIPYVLIEETQ